MSDSTGGASAFSGRMGNLEKTIRMYASRGARMARAHRPFGGGAFVRPVCCGRIGSKRHANAGHSVRSASLHRGTLTCSAACTCGRRCTHPPCRHFTTAAGPRADSTRTRRARVGVSRNATGRSINKPRDCRRGFLVCRAERLRGGSECFRIARLCYPGGGRGCISFSLVFLVSLR